MQMVLGSLLELLRTLMRRFPKFFVYIVCPDNMLKKIKNLYHRTDFRQTLIHTSSKHNNALHDFTLNNQTVSRFVGTGGFLNRYSNGHTK